MDLAGYIQYLSADSEPAQRSYLWDHYVSRLKTTLAHVLDRGRTADLLAVFDSLERDLHYGFHEQEAPLDRGAVVDLAEAARRALRKSSKALVSEEHTAEDVASFLFLASTELLSDYLTLAEAMKFKPDMASARHFYYAIRLREALDRVGQTRPLRILEIGAGAGNLARILCHYGLVRDYTILDLSEMLLMSGSSLVLRDHEECHFRVFPPVEVESRCFYLLSSAQDSASIPDSIFDVCLNFNSFSEMTPELVQHYFSLILRTAKAGSLFMHVNRIQDHGQADGSVIHMNPLLFPHHQQEEILVHSIDPFQQFVRQIFRPKPVQTAAFMRIARLPSA